VAFPREDRCGYIQIDRQQTPVGGSSRHWENTGGLEKQLKKQGSDPHAELRTASLLSLTVCVTNRWAAANT